jgi:hypothetical protein
MGREGVRRGVKIKKGNDMLTGDTRIGSRLSKWGSNLN